MCGGNDMENNTENNIENNIEEISDNKEKKHLPLYGVGPAYVSICILLTVLGLVLEFKGVLEHGGVEYTPISSITATIAIMLVFWTLGIVFLVLGGAIWFSAVKVRKIDHYIINNKLATTGVYSYVRNPIYSGITMMLTGIILLTENYWMLILPVIFWIFMTVLMICTEEKWLRNLYGQEYIDYCKNVNRCIPWFPKNQD